MVAAETYPALPAVSVIIPCRNERAHMEACLRSILAFDKVDSTIGSTLNASTDWQKLREAVGGLKGKQFSTKSEAAKAFGDEAAQALQILYGGSVKPDNAKALMSQPEIDGALVGGASLDPKSFAAIVKY